MRTLTLTLTATFLLAALAVPAASAIPQPIFEAWCPKPGYYVISYPLEDEVNYCYSTEQEDEPRATYPEPGIGIGFSPKCYVDDDVCVERICPPTGGFCWAGPPHPNVRVYERDYHFTNAFHVWVEVTAACGLVQPCSVQHSVYLDRVYDLLP